MEESLTDTFTEVVRADRRENQAAKMECNPAAPPLPIPKPTIIEPKKGWIPVNLQELWEYRELLYFLVWRDIKVRYKQTVIGVAWAVIQPIVSMAIFSIIFGTLANMPSQGVPYPMFVFAGLLPWTFFSSSVSTAGLSLVSEANLIKKTYFPRLFVPFVPIGVSFVDFLLGGLVYAAIMIFYRHSPGANMLLLPLLILVTIVAAAGMGYLLAGGVILYRDFRHIIPFAVQAWMYASPVVYPVNLCPEKFQWIMALNPMVGIIDAFRCALLNQPMRWTEFCISSAVAAGLFIIGIFTFRRTERRFADVA
jgi:lipopolysaccharide transport system permease protein